MQLGVFLVSKYSFLHHDFHLHFNLVVFYEKGK